MHELHNNGRSAIYSLPMNEQTFRVSTLWAWQCITYGGEILRRDVTQLKANEGHTSAVLVVSLHCTIEKNKTVLNFAGEQEKKCNCEDIPVTDKVY